MSWNGGAVSPEPGSCYFLAGDKELVCAFLVLETHDGRSEQAPREEYP